MSMLSPKRSKFRKSHKGNLKGRAKGGDQVSFGDYGLQVTSPGWITARQIEAARVAISRSVKKLGKIYVRVFPDHPVTKKPAETRMGTGKGGVEGWIAVVRPGDLRGRRRVDRDRQGGVPSRPSQAVGQDPADRPGDDAMSKHVILLDQ